MDFVRDFFFTDVMNHVEFLKWTQTLDKEDDVLLIGILERLASSDELTPLVPFYGSVQHDSEWHHKNPLNTAKGYALMQELDGHDYNIYEFAYLATASWRTKAVACLAATIQICFFVVLVCYNVFEQGVLVTPGEDFFVEVFIVMIVSTALFGAALRSQFKQCQKFNATMRELNSSKGREIFLILNRIINQWLGVCVFFFNIYFILISDNPTEAVLNSIALAFIIEIDDQFKPNWNEEVLEDKIAAVLRDYIMEPFDSEQVVVTREGPSITDEGKFYVLVTDDEVKDEIFSVTVFAALERDPKSNVTTSYDKTVYQISGPRAHELERALRRFYCLEKMMDIIV